MNWLTELPASAASCGARARRPPRWPRSWRGGGFHEEPARYHRAPAPPDAVRRTAARVWLGRAADALRAALVRERLRAARGRARRRALARHPRNHTLHAQLFEHAGEPRPWVVCVHGFGMGTPLANFAASSRSGCTASSAGTWCCRACRCTGGAASGGCRAARCSRPTICAWCTCSRRASGTCGASSRGSARAAARDRALRHLARRLRRARSCASLEDDLAGVVAGIPAVDFPNLARDHEPRVLRRYGDDARIDWEQVRGGDATRCRRSRSRRACRASAASSSRASPTASRAPTRRARSGATGSAARSTGSRAATSRRSGTPRSRRSSTLRCGRARLGHRTISWLGPVDSAWCGVQAGDREAWACLCGSFRSRSRASWPPPSTVPPRAALLLARERLGPAVLVGRFRPRPVLHDPRRAARRDDVSAAADPARSRIPPRRS